MPATRGKIPQLKRQHLLKFMKSAGHNRTWWITTIRFSSAPIKIGISIISSINEISNAISFLYFKLNKIQFALLFIFWTFSPLKLSTAFNNHESIHSFDFNWWIFLIKLTANLSVLCIDPVKHFRDKSYVRSNAN